MPRSAFSAVMGGLLLAASATTASPAQAGLLSPYIARAGQHTDPRVAASETTQNPIQRLIDGFQQGLNLATYRVRTVYVKPDGSTIEKSVPAVALIGPLVLSIDVDNNLVPDVYTEILPALPPNMVSVHFGRYTPAFARQLPVLVEVQLDVPGGVGATIGIDAREGNLPFLTSASARVGIAALLQNQIDADLSLRAIGGSGPASYVAGTFIRGADGAQIDPTRVSVRMDPLPAQLTLGAVLDSGAAPSAELSLGLSEPSLVTASVQTASGTRRQSLDASIDRLPGDVTVRFKDDGQGAADVNYLASAPIDNINASLVTRNNGKVLSNIVARVEDLPSVVDVHLAPPAINASAVGSIGVVEAGLSNTETSPLLAGIAEAGYVHMDTLTHNRTGQPFPDVQRLVAARIRGLRSVSFDAGDTESVIKRPMSLALDFGGGTFRAQVTTRDRQDNNAPRPLSSIVSLADALPPFLQLDVDQAAAKFRYSGSAPLALLKTTAAKRDVVSIGAPGLGPDRLDVTLHDLPKDIEVSLAAGANAGSSLEEQPVVDIRAGTTDPLTDRVQGDGIGMIEVLLTRGGQLPPHPLAPGEEGFSIESDINELSLQGRISGIKQVKLLSGGQPLNTVVATRSFLNQRVVLDRKAGPPLLVRADLRKVELEPQNRFIEATIDGLDGLIDLQIRQLVFQFCERNGQPFDTVLSRCVSSGGEIVDDPRGNHLIYQSEKNIERIDLRTDLVDSPHPLELTLQDIPQEFELCVARDRSCMVSLPDNFSRDISTRFSASAPMRIDMTLCRDRADSFALCDRSDPIGIGFFARNLRLSNFRFDFRDLESEVRPLKLGASTDNQGIKGRLIARLPKDDDTGENGARVQLNAQSFLTDLEGAIRVSTKGGRASIKVAPLSANDGRLTIDNLRFSLDNSKEGGALQFVLFNSTLFAIPEIGIGGGIVCQPDTQLTITVPFLGAVRELVSVNAPSLLCSNF